MEVAFVGAVLALILSFSNPAPAELVVLLPEKDGGTGTLVVEGAGNRIVLDRPYAASRVEGGGGPQPAQITQQEVRTTFNSALAALPARPVSFLLYFVTGTDDLTDDSKSELARILAQLRDKPVADIVVIGHTDRVGGVEANDQLSLQRAERVKAELVKQGIAAERIRAAGRGERELLVPTADGVEEPRNRRVEINIR